MAFRIKPFLWGDDVGFISALKVLPRSRLASSKRTFLAFLALLVFLGVDYPKKFPGAFFR